MRRSSGAGRCCTARSSSSSAKSRWNDLDYLIVDMPPGTGDVALSLSQTVPVAGVDRRDDAAAGVAGRHAGARCAMYQKLNIPPLGIDREHELLRRARTAITRPTSSATAAASGWRRSWACRSSAACRSTSRFARAATPACRSSSASPSRRRRARSSRVAERTAAQVSIASYTRADDSAHRRVPMNIAFQQAHARQRPRRARPRGSRVPDRGGEPLVSRRIEERDARPHRLRAPVRAPDVRRVRASRHAATSRRCRAPARC